MVKSGSMVTGCPDRPEHRPQISHRDATLRPNLSPKLHARQPKLVYSELFRASLDPSRGLGMTQEQGLEDKGEVVYETGVAYLDGEEGEGAVLYGCEVF